MYLSYTTQILLKPGPILKQRHLKALDSVNKYPVYSSHSHKTPSSVKFLTVHIVTILFNYINVENEMGFNLSNLTSFLGVFFGFFNMTNIKL